MLRPVLASRRDGSELRLSEQTITGTIAELDQVVWLGFELLQRDHGSTLPGIGASDDVDGIVQPEVGTIDVLPSEPTICRSTIQSNHKRDAAVYRPVHPYSRAASRSVNW